jgi:lipopolysaccharide export system permease protein
MRSRSESALIAPGLFAESSAGQRVYYVESLNPLTGIVRNVFMQSRIDGQLGLVVAREGSHTELADGSRYLVFKDGRRYEGTPGQLDYRIVQFERYWMRLDPVATGARQTHIRQMRWRSCWQRSLAAGTRRAAVADRGSAFRADSLRDGDSAQLRQHAGAPLLWAGDRAAAVFRLQQLLSLSQAWVAQEKLNPWAGMLSPHLLMLGAVVGLFYLRSRQYSPRRRRA